MKIYWKILITWGSVSTYVGLWYAFSLVALNPNFLHLGLPTWLLISFVALNAVIGGIYLAKFLITLWRN